MRWAPLIVLVAAAACARSNAARTLQPGQPIGEELAAVEQLLRAGCLDCLAAAFDRYDELRKIPEATGEATSGAIQAALLAELRERELGVADEDYLRRARRLIDASADPAGFSELSDIVETVPWRWERFGRAPGSASGLEVFRKLASSRASWLESLRRRADEDPLHAVVWVSFACTNVREANERQPDALLAPLSTYRNDPIVRFELATCGEVTAEALDRIVHDDRRYREAHFYYGMAALAHQQLDDVEAALALAVEWHPRWPSALLALGGVYLTGEEFEKAAAVYNAALDVEPGQPDALLGVVKAASYAGRHASAIDAARELLTTGFFPGEAYYWRAWNEAQLDRVDAAWDDVGRAERAWVNSEVAKLAGIVAYKRRDLETAQAKFETAVQLNPDDCEAAIDRSTVLADRRLWSPSVDGFVSASSCLDRQRDSLRREIASLGRASTEGRRARLVERREQQIEAGGRMQAQSWFNIATACFNLSRIDEARRYAERLVDDEQYGSRARDLLARLR